ncbi:hypothetical protein CMI38_04615 [Candidatus Pacearchaeota archaeon]|jgi:hypothetical protein|nr:hypothetical protein [Candidatus Pacearchaeota archaeon]|tara:strand:- start:182 stop:700 length:519 start_codon:yes stop_codon:yes gene_type:complete
MTKKLEELLDLPEVKEAISKAEQDEIREVEPELADFELKPKEESPIKDLESTNRKLDKIEEALPPVDGLEDIGSEMDNIAGEAMKTYKDLMDLGMNVEARYSGRIFEVAATMMRNAVDAKAAKIEKKLKMVELQLKKRKMDQEFDGEEPIEAEGSIIFDRNELLKRIANSDK